MAMSTLSTRWRSTTRTFIVIAAVALALTVGVRRAGADGAWIDQKPIVNWNAAAQTIPIAPPMTDPVNPQCASTGRPPETDEDRAIAAAGWTLIGTYQGGYGVKTVTGASGYDGMCRPLGFQTFIFYHESFIGTVSPDLMNSRSDGVQQQIFISPPLSSTGGPPSLIVQFSRYTNADPLCCPSAISTVNYTIRFMSVGWVLTPGEASTMPTA